MKLLLCIVACLSMFTLKSLAQEILSISDYVEVDQEPKPLNLMEIKQKVGYPLTARNNCVEGNVVMRILLDESGKYVRHMVLNDPNPTLTQAVEMYLSGLMFSPALKSGQAVKFWVNVPFAFRLLGDCNRGTDSKAIEPEIKDNAIVDSPPKPENLEEIYKQIGYPTLARENKLEGMIVARILVSEEGEYIRHKMIKTAHPLLEDAVASALPGIRFSPARQDGKAVRFWVNLPFNFKLVGQPEPEAKTNTELVISQAGTLMLYPNPGAQSVQLRLRSQKVLSETKLELTDQQGKVLINQTFQPEGYEWSHRLDVSYLTSGMYHLKVTLGNEVMTKTWIKE